MARLVYSAHLAGSGGPCRFVLNGAIVFEYTGVHSIRIVMPLNQWVLAGPNSAEAWNCGVRLERSDLDVPERPPEILDTAVPDVFLAEAPFPPWEWIGSPAIGTVDEERTLEQIRHEQRNVFLMLLEGDSEGLALYSGERTREMAAAYYRDSAAQHIKNRSSFEEIANEPGFTLAPVDWDSTTLQVHPGRRLVSLQASDLRPVFRYRSEDGSSSIYVPFTYRRSQLGNWVVCR